MKHFDFLSLRFWFAISPLSVEISVLTTNDDPLYGWICYLPCFKWWLLSPSYYLISNLLLLMKDSITLAKMQLNCKTLLFKFLWYPFVPSCGVGSSNDSYLSVVKSLDLRCSLKSVIHVVVSVVVLFLKKNWSVEVKVGRNCCWHDCVFFGCFQDLASHISGHQKRFEVVKFHS